MQRHVNDILLIFVFLRYITGDTDRADDHIAVENRRFVCLELTQMAIRLHDLFIKQTGSSRGDDIVLGLDADIVARLVDLLRDIPDIVMIPPSDIRLFLRDHRTKSVIDLKVYALHILEPNHIGKRVDRRLQPIFPQPCALVLGDPR